MPFIQTDISEDSLSTAVRANLCDFFRHLTRSQSERQFENGVFTRWHSALGHPWFNGVLSSYPPDKADEKFIEETIAFFQAQNVRAFTWWAEPHLKASDWASILSRYGFGFNNTGPGMALDLQRLPESMQTLDGLEIRPVTDEDSLSTWAHAFVAGFGIPADWESSIYELWPQLGLDFPTRNYLGYWNGEPVATSSLFFGGGVAGIYSVSTLPGARGRGIGTAMTLTPLFHARQMRYRIGILQSSQMGYNVYKRIGFRHLCQIENFSLSLR